MNNVKTVTGRNVNFILKETGADNIFGINISQLKRTYHFVKLDGENQWKIDFVKEIPKCA